MSPAPASDVTAARRSHVLEYLTTHPEGATPREVHAAAVESGEIQRLGWDPRFAGAGALLALVALLQAGEVAVVAQPIGKPSDPVPGPLDQRYVIAQLALL